MSEVIVTIEGLKGLKRAISRNPAKVKEEVGKFLVRGMAEYRKVIMRRPWEVGAGGGGAPVDTTAMRQHHRTKIRGFRASIGPNLRTTPYALFVHEGTHKMEGRPWLNFAKNKADSRIRILSENLLDKITKDLAK